jgi:hypothetical protein
LKSAKRGRADAFVDPAADIGRRVKEIPDFLIVGHKPVFGASARNARAGLQIIAAHTPIE